VTISKSTKQQLELLAQKKSGHFTSFEFKNSDINTFILDNTNFFTSKFTYINRIKYLLGILDKSFEHNNRLYSREELLNLPYGLFSSKHKGFYKNNRVLIESLFDFHITKPSEYYYVLTKNIQHRPKCKNPQCNNEVEFGENKYKIYCSKKCQLLHNNSFKEIKISNLSKSDIKKIISEIPKDRMNLTNEKLANIYGNIPILTDNVQENVYLYYNGLTSIPTCLVCRKNELIFGTFGRGYRETCGENKCVIESKIRTNRDNKLISNQGSFSDLGNCKKCKKLIDIRRTYCSQECVYADSELRSSISKKGMDTKIQFLKKEGIAKHLFGVTLEEAKQGIINCSQKEDIREIINETNISKYNHKNSFHSPNGRTQWNNWLEMNYKSGVFIWHQKTDFEIYVRTVWRHTKRNNLKKLKNYELRGNILEKEDAHHLDHKYSIRQGFEDNIPAYIIGNINNLEFISANENSKKGRACSITSEDLYNLIFGTLEKK
jgi:hypothetical protein